MDSEDTPQDPLKVLVVEDNENLQTIFKTILNSLQFEVDLANNGEQALTLFNLNEYDLVFMDIRMPIMDGIEATRKIRKNEKAGRPRTPIIAFSSNTSTEDKQMAMNAGMNDFLEKPFDIKAFKGILIKWTKWKPE